MRMWPCRHAILLCSRRRRYRTGRAACGLTGPGPMSAAKASRAIGAPAIRNGGDVSNALAVTATRSSNACLQPASREYCCRAFSLPPRSSGCSRCGVRYRKQCQNQLFRDWPDILRLGRAVHSELPSRRKHIERSYRRLGSAFLGHLRRRRTRQAPCPPSPRRPRRGGGWRTLAGRSGLATLSQFTPTRTVPQSL